MTPVKKFSFSVTTAIAACVALIAGVSPALAEKPTEIRKIGKGFKITNRTAVSTSGYEFTQVDTYLISNSAAWIDPYTRYMRPRLGWKDKDGRVWTAPPLGVDSGTLRKMSQPDAVKYCEKIGAKLPTYSEYNQLRRMLGAQFPGGELADGYTPQILPGLTLKGNRETRDLQYWTSTTEVSDFYAFVFNGTRGDFDVFGTGIDDWFSVQCVYQQ